jgi:hypothetical protein
MKEEEEERVVVDDDMRRSGGEGVEEGARVEHKRRFSQRMRVGVVICASSSHLSRGLDDEASGDREVSDSVVLCVASFLPLSSPLSLLNPFPALLVVRSFVVHRPPHLPSGLSVLVRFSWTDDQGRGWLVEFGQHFLQPPNQTFNAVLSKSTDPPSTPLNLVCAHQAGMHITVILSAHWIKCNESLEQR